MPSVFPIRVNFGSEAAVSAGSFAPRLLDVTLSTDTSAYASGDLIADTQLIADAFSTINGKGSLHSIQVIDQDDQKVDLDIYLCSTSASFGTENAAPSITDAAALGILCRIPALAANYYDLGGVAHVDLAGLNRLIEAEQDTRNLYVAVVNGTGAPTYTAAGLHLRIGILE